MAIVGFLTGNGDRLDTHFVCFGAGRAGDFRTRPGTFNSNCSYLFWQVLKRTTGPLPHPVLLWQGTPASSPPERKRPRRSQEPTHRRFG
jgi:hypothetical protein